MREMKRIAFLLLLPLCAAAGRCELRFGTMGAVKSAEEALEAAPAGSPAVVTQSTGTPTDTTCTDQQLAQLEQSMTTALSTAATDADFTLLLEAADGRRYSRSRGASTATTPYESASSSKLVSAVVILSLVERGFLGPNGVDANARDFISWWTTMPSAPEYGVTLRHLLSFRSGLEEDPPPIFPILNPIWGCMDLPGQNFESCVQDTYDENVGNGPAPVAPGTEFFYASSHLQFAGLMAVKARSASDVSYSSWSAVFNEFKSRTGLFPNSDYNLPSSSNPRLAGGMTWTGEDYLGFLRALYNGQLLSPALRNELWANQRGSAVVGLGGTASPLILGMGEDWPYGLGNWLECEPGTNCVLAGRNSSPGAYGAYPFLDFKNGYFGILARQGELGTFRNGAALFRTVQDTAGKWATKSCGE